MANERIAIVFRAPFPLTLPLREGLRWKGKLKVLERVNGGEQYLVAFDAEIVNPDVIERIVYDVGVLTAAQLKAWTGWEESE